MGGELWEGISLARLCSRACCPATEGRLLGPIPFSSLGTGVFATVCAAWCIYLCLEISKGWLWEREMLATSVLLPGLEEKAFVVN